MSEEIIKGIAVQIYVVLATCATCEIYVFLIIYGHSDCTVADQGEQGLCVSGAFFICIT